MQGRNAIIIVSNYCAILSYSAISEHFARKWVVLTIGLEKRSGRPEQWPKIGQKYDLIRRNRPFLGHLEKFGENWIPIWIKC